MSIKMAVENFKAHEGDGWNRLQSVTTVTAGYSRSQRLQPVTASHTGYSRLQPVTPVTAGYSRSQRLQPVTGSLLIMEEERYFE